MRKDRQVIIINFNTPELTEAAILSLRKHGGQDYEVTVVDNSQDVDYPDSDRIKGMKMKARPFTKQMEGVRVVDNTRGQLVNIDAELEKYTHNMPWYRTYNNWGSVRHMITIQALFDLMPDGFLLMESDVLLKRSVDFMFRPDLCCVGFIHEQKYNMYHIERMVPFLCYINPRKCREAGVQYYDPNRCWMLKGDRNDRNNWYDTGASFIEDIKRNKPRSRGIKLSRDFFLSMIEHLGAGSWKDDSRRDGMTTATEWLLKNRQLWMPEHFERPKTDKVAVCAIGRLENRYAKEFVQHHLKLGFDKVIIYDNNHDGEEQFEKVLKTYITKKQVEVIDWRNREHEQNEAYRDCYIRYGNQYQWIAFFDFDEHLKLTTAKNIKDVLKDIEADVVTLNWRIMTDNNLVVDDKKSTLEKRFTQPAPADVRNEEGHMANRYVKSIVRGGLPMIAWKSPHCPVVPGKYAYIDGKPAQCSSMHPADYTVARLDHFCTKTIEEYMMLKRRRGVGFSPANTERLRRDAAKIFFLYNERTPMKEEWLRMNGFSE